MDYRKKLVALVAPLLIAGSGAFSVAHGAGYAVFTQGASSLGQGNAVTAHTESPSTIFYNPALMNKLDGTQLEAGTTLIWASREFDGVSGSHSSNDNVFFPSTFYATHKFNDSLSAGLGVFNPFGLGTEWKDDWEGKYIATKSELTTYNINPAVSYRVIPALSVAAGLDVVFLDAKLEQINAQTNTNQKFKGDGTGVGFNVAAAYDVTKAATVGVSYRSEVDVDIDGDVNITGVGGSKGKTSVRLPAQLTAGVSYKVSDPLILEAGIRWEQWSAFRNLTIQLEDGNRVTTQRRWHDTLGMNVGGKYQLNDTVSLSAGYIFGDNAVPKETFDPSIPDSDTHIFCVGTGLNYNPIKIDFSYAYQYYTNRTKENNVGQQGNITLPPTLQANGKYKSDAHLFALSLGYKF